jgi:hypothetical protein
MNAEQYRALVQKLEAIQEADATEPPNMAAAMDTTAPAVDPNAPATAPTVTTPAAAATTEIPTIDAPTFSQAYAQAAKQGLKKFKWCGTYAVKARVKPRPPVMPQPKAVPGGTAINDRNPNGSYVGQIGLDSQTPSYSPNSAE